MTTPSLRVRNGIRPILGIAVSSTILAASGRARGDAADYVASARGEIGVGLGNFDLAGRAGLSADYWLSQGLGLGAQLGAIAQFKVFGRNGEAFFAGPEVAFRSYPNKTGFWLFTGSAGYAHNIVATPIPCPQASSQLCLVSAGSSTAHSDGAYWSLELGYMSDERRVVQLGFGLRGDAIGWPSIGDATPQLVATLNVIVGFKLW